MVSEELSAEEDKGVKAEGTGSELNPSSTQDTGASSLAQTIPANPETAPAEASPKQPKRPRVTGAAAK